MESTWKKKSSKGYPLPRIIFYAGAKGTPYTLYATIKQVIIFIQSMVGKTMKIIYQVNNDSIKIQPFFIEFNFDKKKVSKTIQVINRIILKDEIHFNIKDGIRSEIKIKGSHATNIKGSLCICFPQ